MRKLNKFLWLSFIVFYVLSVLNPAAAAGSELSRSLSYQNEPEESLQLQEPGAVELIASGNQGVRFEIQVPWQTLKQEIVTIDGQEYVQLSLPGWNNSSQPGHPTLPFLVSQLGVPHGVQLSVQVTPGPAHTITLPAPVLPAVTRRPEPGPRHCRAGSREVHTPGGRR